MRWNGGLFSVDVTYNLYITYRSPAVFGNHYSAYQLFQYERITEQREKGKTFEQIAEWVNEKGYLSVRGRKFKGNHFHSIVKKKRLKDKKLERDYSEVRSDFSLKKLTNV